MRTGHRAALSVLIDSNTLIYYLNAALPPEAKAKLETCISRGAHISIITRIEILGWPGHTDIAYHRARDLLDLLTEHPLTEGIANLCISVRQKRRIKTPDAITTPIRFPAHRWKGRMHGGPRILTGLGGPRRPDRTMPSRDQEESAWRFRPGR